MSESAALIRIRGVVQGVGFRPTMWRLAQRHGLRGWVANDGDGVRIHVCGPAAAIENFVLALPGESPPLARIDGIERGPAAALPADAGFHIAASVATGSQTGIAADAATCAACRAEIFDPFARRFRYPFTNCTHCGPRFSIIDRVPYDRANTRMAQFAICAECGAEYHDPADRRFHAEPIACHACGPRLDLNRADALPMTLESLSALDAADAACTLLQRGHIVAIQGLGGYQLACDATHGEAIRRLRRFKQRAAKPFAMMARDLAVIRRHALVSETEEALLTSCAAPIVLLRTAAATDAPHGTARAREFAAVATEVAPGVALHGFMLPSSPLHHLVLARMQRPIVLTSGNRSDEPQAIEAEDARHRLGCIAEYFLEHNRPIARRVDDSVVRVAAGRPRVLRRARGYAPASMVLPPGFEDAASVLALGGELKNTFCLLRHGRAVLSAHVGDLRDALTRADFERAVADFRGFLQFEPEAIACDLHPDYASSAVARAAAGNGLPLIETQHHHAHVAACMAENGVPRLAPAVLGVALDGMGYGADGALWGGEFLLADYTRCRRLGTFKPVALLGGEAAVREPWRSTYAHIMAQMGWAGFAMNYSSLELYEFLERQPRPVLDTMLRRGLNSPPASSCGRLFDAAAAAMGIARERACYEGQGAVEMEAAVDLRCLREEDDRLSYPFSIPLLDGMPYIEPLGFWSALFGDLILNTPVGVMAARFHRGLSNAVVRMVGQLAATLEDRGPRPLGFWSALFGDLILNTPVGVMAARFHRGLSNAVVRMVEQLAAPLADRGPRPLVALSGGVFQNRIFIERVVAGLEGRGFTVLTHSQVPTNDGGLALGQAVIAAARLLEHGRRGH